MTVNVRADKARIDSMTNNSSTSVTKGQGIAKISLLSATNNVSTPFGKKTNARRICKGKMDHTGCLSSTQDELHEPLVDAPNAAGPWHDGLFCGGELAIYFEQPSIHLESDPCMKRFRRHRCMRRKS